MVTDKESKKFPAIYDDFKFPDDNSVIFHLLSISFAPAGQILAKKGKKWIILNNMENYGNKHKENSNNFIAYSPEIKNSVEFKDNYVNVNFNEINFSKEALLKDTKFKLDNKLRSLSSVQIAIKPTKNIFGQPNVKTVKQNYYFKGGFLREDILPRLVEIPLFILTITAFCIFNIYKYIENLITE